LEIKQVTLFTIINTIKKAFLYNFFISFVLNVLSLVLPLYSLQVLDRVISSQSFETLTMLSVIALFIYSIIGLLNGVRSYVFIAVSHWLDKTLTIQVVKSALFSIKDTHSLELNTTLRDVGVLKGFVTGQVISTLFDLPWVIIFLVVIYFIHPLLAIVTLVGSVVLILFAWINEKSTAADQVTNSQALSKNISKLDKISRHLDVIQAMKMQPDILDRWFNVHENILDSQNETIKNGALISSSTRFVRMVIQLLTTGIGGYLVLKFEMTAGGIIAVSILAGKVLAPFDQSIFVWRTLVSVRDSFSRLKQLLLCPESIKKMFLPDLFGGLELEGVSLILGTSQEYFLKGIQFKLEPGESLGIIGPSGAGKTTLSKLLTSIVKPTKGEVRLDGASIDHTPKWTPAPFVALKLSFSSFFQRYLINV
jgi:ABC-type protease/lipase transport system fused ATPase/permease subunit